jgi:hypothetical protein
VHAGFEGFVKGADPVRSEKEKTFVVLKHAKEYRHDTVAIEVLASSAGEEYVCFIKQHYTIPLAGKPEVSLQIRLDIMCGAAKVAACDGVQWLLHLFGYTLGSARFANTWRSCIKSVQRLNCI